MSLDVNKILMETLEEDVQEGQNVVQEGEEGTHETKTGEEVVNEEGEGGEGLPVGIYASAVSAGLGALSLRNRLRSVYEMSDEAKRKLKKAGKVAGAAGTLGGAAAGTAYAVKNPEKVGEMVDKAKESGKDALDKVKEKFASGTKDVAGKRPGV